MFTGKIPPYNFLGIFYAGPFGPCNVRCDVLIFPSLNYAWTQFCLFSEIKRNICQVLNLPTEDAGERSKNKKSVIISLYTAYLWSV